VVRGAVVVVVDVDGDVDVDVGTVVVVVVVVWVVVVVVAWVVVVVDRVVVVVALGAVVTGALGSMVAVVGVDGALWLAAVSSATAVKVWVPAASVVVVTDQCPVEVATVPPRSTEPSRR
jgi:hypothetical protein